MLCRSVVAVVGALVVVACLPTVPCACPPALSHGVVFGEVLTADGLPVPGASIEVVPRFADCQRPPWEHVEGRAHTDERGAYEAYVSTPFMSGQSCLEVRAIRTRGQQIDTVATSGVHLELRHERTAPERRRVDLVFP
jgi:hypothetical protein